MIVNQRILCPTDLPMESDEAVRYAMALSSAAEIDLNRILVTRFLHALRTSVQVSLGQEYQSELHLLHVLTKEERDQPEVAWAKLGSESSYKSVANLLQAPERVICLVQGC